MYCILSLADKSGAFRNVLAVEDRVVVDQQEQHADQQGSLGPTAQPEGGSTPPSAPASSEGPQQASPSTPCATEGGQGGDSGARGRLLVVEETQVRVGHYRGMTWILVVTCLYLTASERADRVIGHDMRPSTLYQT